MTDKQPMVFWTHRPLLTEGGDGTGVRGYLIVGDSKKKNTDLLPDEVSQVLLQSSERHKDAARAFRAMAGTYARDGKRADDAKYLTQLAQDFERQSDACRTVLEQFSTQRTKP